jgi:hypothetical protein
MELPGQTLSNPSSSESPFVALFGASGSLSFAKVYEIASGSNQTDGVHFDDGGDLLVAMHVSKTVDLGAGALDATSNSTGSSDLVLARLSASGSVVWNRRLATEGFEYNFRLAGEGSTMTVLGEYSAQNKDVDFGTGVVHSSDNFDVILAQFSAQDGATEWVRSFGCTEWDRPAEVTAVGNRACFIGSFKVSLDYGGTAPLTFAKAFSPLVCLTP